MCESKNEYWSEGGLMDEIQSTIDQLGWDPKDKVEVVIGGSSVYEIEGAGTKWAPTKGTRKYNKDAFIVIRKPSSWVSSLPLEEFKPYHNND